MSDTPLSFKQWLRVSVFVLPPLLVTIWTSIPALQPKPVTVTGEVTRANACVLLCAPVVAIANERIACRTDLLGVSYKCRDKLTQQGVATVTYAAMPSLARLIGMSPTTGVLLKMEREGKVIYSRSIADQVWAGLYGGWVFHAIYWPIVGFIIWRWPNSRISKRATWQDYAEEEAKKKKS
jgi:hypothetical protein